MGLRRHPAPARFDIAREATEVIALESFTPWMSREIQRGERFPREADIAKTYPAFFGPLLPLTELEEVN